MAKEFPIVAHVVLDGGAHALALHARDVGDGRARGKKGILAIIFKISSA